VFSPVESRLALSPGEGDHLRRRRQFPYGAGPPRAKNPVIESPQLQPLRGIKMDTLTLHRNLIKNVVIAATLALSVFASWAVTGLSQPVAEITTISTVNS